MDVSCSVFAEQGLRPTPANLSEVQEVFKFFRIDMTIITISRGFCCNGQEVAENVAKQLGYRSVSNEVIYDAAEKFRIPHHTLGQALHDAPSVLQRFTSEKQKYVAYVAAEILDHFAQDNVVYHGLAGQFFAKDVAHILRVRLMTNPADRIAMLMKRKNLSQEQAAAVLRRDDRERKVWSRWYYGEEAADLTLYDMIIHVDRMTVNKTVDLICEAVRQPRYQADCMSQAAVENLALAARIKASLLAEFPVYDVIAEGKSVEITVRFTMHTDTAITNVIKDRVLRMPGVSSVSVNLIPSSLFT